MAPRRESEVALSPLLDKTKTMFSRILPQNIGLETQLEHEAFILADEGEVLRVLMNLAPNARNAMRDGGKLVIRVRPPTTLRLFFRGGESRHAVVHTRRAQERPNMLTAPDVSP